MDKKKLESVFNAIEPDSELILRTKAKMQLAAKSRRRAWFSPFFRLAAAACLIIAVTSTLLVANHLGQPKVFAGYFTETDAFIYTAMPTDLFIIDDDLHLPGLESEDSLHAFEEQFLDYARAESGVDTRLLGIRGEVISLSTYLARDKEEFGILGLTMAKVKISEITYSKNRGRRPRVDDVITVTSYFNASGNSGANDIWVGGSFLFYLYTGSGYNPADSTGELIGLKQSWLRYRVFPDN